MMDLTTATGITAAVVTAVGGIYTSYRHVTLGMAIKREKYKEDILNQAKGEMSRIEDKFEEKIKKIEIELESQKLSVSKDLGHMREIYNAEIKTLGEKIDDLRSDLQDQHQSMVALLTRLVNSK